MPLSSTEWLSPPETLALAPKEIHVWRANLDCSAEILDEFRSYLSPDELEKAASFYFEAHRNHYAASRGILRKLLSGYLGKSPAEFAFSYSNFGKPSLANTLRFNLSHSHGLALYAFCPQHELGIDLEKIRPELAGPEIAERFFSTPEAEAVKASGSEAFFRCWTRKEAFVKAHGTGLSLPLNKFTVDIGDNARLLSVEFDPSEMGRWSLYSINPGADYEGALAVEGSNHALRFWNYDSRTATAAACAAV